MSLPRIALGAIAALLALPPVAGAHSIVRQSGGETSYLSSDAVSLNTLDATASGTEIRLSDPTVDGGIDPGSSCRPGRTDANGFVTEVFCPRTGMSRVRVELGEREDKLTSTLDIAILALGGGGADTLATGQPADVLVGNEGNDTLDGGPGDDQVNGNEGDDTLRGSAGNDVVQAGPGADVVEAGPGDDDVRLRDGSPDRVACGDGADRVDADAGDEVAADCETVTRSSTTPAPGPTDPGSPGSGAGSPGGGTPGGATPLRDDRTAPRLEVGGSTSQRLARTGVVRVLATASERGTMAASGFLDIAGLALPLKSAVHRVPTAGGGVAITVKLSRGQLSKVRRALRRRRRVTVRLDVVATDVAGNSVTAKAPRIRLRR